MSLVAEWVGFGAAALDRLAAVVAAAQNGDPLAPVTVVVPTNPVGVSARRALGARPGGVANVEFTTIDRLANDIAGPILAARGSSALTDQIRAAAVRRVLATRPRCLEPVRHHASTDRAVAEALAVIHRAGAEDLLRTGGRRLARDVVAIGDDVSALTIANHDETDLATVAAEHATAVAPVVVFLPDWFFHAQRLLVSALAAQVEVRMLLGATGDPGLDQRSTDLAAALGVDTVPPAFDPLTPTEVRSASDADDEARHAVRWLLTRREQGVPFHRMAVLYTAADPYRRALHHHLDAAGIPSNGPSLVTVGETIVGRVVTNLLALVGSRLRRDEVMAFIASGPLRSPDGVRVRPTFWDQQSRAAGVVRDLEQWESRLEARSARLLARSPEPGSWAARQAEQCDDLRRFVATLAADLTQPGPGASWRDLVSWLKGLLARYIPTAAGRVDWPELEQESVERFDLTLDLLAGLDDIEPSPTWESFRAAIDVELARTTRRVGRLGTGVIVGPLSSGVGAELDAVTIVGAVEGLAPRQVRHSVVLGAVEHERVGPDLGGDSLDLQRRRYLAALASSSGPRLVTWSRGEMRTGRRRYRSRWIDGIEGLDESSWPSYSAALTQPDGDPAANLAEWELRRLAVLDDLEAHESPLVASMPLLRTGAAAISARRWGGLGPWAGGVDPNRLVGVLDQVLSPTALEQFGQCSFRFFLSHVLQITGRDDPEDRVDIDARDRGTAVHLILERLVLERLEAGVDLLPDDADRMAAITEEVFAALEAEGRVGHPLHWELERELIADQLADFRQFDSELRAAGSTPLAAELRFGFGDAPPVEVTIGDRVFRFRGTADRVERSADGSVAVVDYKTVTKARSEQTVRSGLHNGQFLQLPLYARAAQERFGGDRATAAYWYLARTNSSARVAVDLHDVDEDFLHALDVYATAIRAGRFAMMPGDVTTWPRATFESCKYCDYDAICPVDRDDLGARQADDPALEQLVELTSRTLEEA